MSDFETFPDDAGLRVERAIEAVRGGGIVVLVDDEDRENEGDLVLAAEKVSPEAINFMAVYGRGLICMSMVPSQIDRLDLPMMVRDNTSPYGTAFTVSIEARTGVTTGISAADRARTIQVAVDPETTATDLVSPGHVFPLRARAGGVLERAGQTEGSVDLARLAGCEPAGVLCEIMNEDGTMARLPQLLEFAEEHELVVLTVADLIAYRLQRETLVHRVASAELHLDAMGTVTAHLFRNGVNQLQYLALVRGDIDPAEPALVRVTSSNLWSDALQAFREDGGPLLNRSMELIREHGTGVVLYVVRPFDADDLLRQLGSVAADVDGELPVEETQADPYPAAFRDYGLGAQVLRELGMQRIRLLTNSDRRLVGVEGYGIEVVERVPVSAEPRVDGRLAGLPGGKD
ncbi:MAG: 3,4-dihydroxy-2-butanone-4-phosphate synthase [Deltaproteobacteria bacterium]|nr:3,4-dihydroxy-2-butanone-4-phosphate synthase [Deltaproteobacteria bacterium]